jgi:pyruvate kinase
VPVTSSQSLTPTLPPSLPPSLPQPLYGSTKKGDPVLIDDGNIVLEVMGHVGDGHGVICKALNSGKIKNRRGVNVPNSKVMMSGREGRV